MMRIIPPLLFGLILFVGFLIAAMPARLIFDLALKPAGVEAGLVQGRVWDAQLLRIRSGQLSIDEARASLEPSSLLRFSPRFDVTLSDPALRGEGVVTLSGGGVRIEDARGVVRLDQVMPELAALGGDEVIQLSLEALALDASGRCEAASGQATTAALIGLGERYGSNLPVLRFDLICAGDRIGADVSGLSDAVEVEGRLQFTERGPEGRIEAQTSVTNVIAALSFMGFEQVNQTTYTLTLPLPEEG
ncbi:type II secretion system protein N [Maricaulaceae bacterium NA33B04]|nr:type II secretion system protein N [Maricaulaceae bacterium NA33B04]